MTSFRLGGALLAAAALLSVAFTSAAAADPAGSTVTLTVHSNEGLVDTVRLYCDPAGGSHPTAAEACAELDAAGGDFAELEEQAVSCTMELRPVTARASGVWNGDPVRWDQEFSNPCMLGAATGSVFDF
jgi:hypothetical protein